MKAVKKIQSRRNSDIKKKEREEFLVSNLLLPFPLVEAKFTAHYPSPVPVK